MSKGAASALPLETIVLRMPTADPMSWIAVSRLAQTEAEAARALSLMVVVIGRDAVRRERARKKESRVMGYIVGEEIYSWKVRSVSRLLVWLV